MSNCNSAKTLFVAILIVHAVEDICTVTIRGSSPSCHSKQYTDSGRLRSHAVHCLAYSWQISPVSNRSVIQLHLIDIRNLLQHFVMYIFDGANAYDYSKRIAKFSSKTLIIPKKVESSGSHMLIVLDPLQRNRTNYWAVTTGLFHITYQIKGECLQDQKRCAFGDNDCYSHEDKCDGFWDCSPSGRDEMHCGCFANRVKCANGQMCYDKEQHCDGDVNCLDRSDELLCSAELCRPDRDVFLCRNRLCVPMSGRCDGVDHCGDGSDETDCTVSNDTKLAFVSIMSAMVCAFGLVLFGGVLCRVHRARMIAFIQSNHPLHREQELQIRGTAPPTYDEAVSSVDRQMAAADAGSDDDVPILDLAGADGNMAGGQLADEDRLPVPTLPVPTCKAHVHVEVVRHDDNWSLVDSMHSDAISVSSMGEETTESQALL